MTVPSSWSGPERKSYPILAEDTYQVVIKDAEIVTGKAYQSDEEVEQIKFTFEIMDPEFKGRLIWKEENAKVAPKQREYPTSLKL